jgi:5-methyltetrahydropteroyltriglutamate--homocysteine methyltransferase
MTLFPTSLVGSYPQPEWLIDRARLAGRFPPRVRAKELWRPAPEFLAQAQDDATRVAIRAQEEAGLDIVTDGEIRRESYSNHFATALSGVDIDNPGEALDRSGHPNPVPRSGRRRRPVPARSSGSDLEFLRAHTDRTVKITVPGPFTMSQQAQDDHYQRPAGGRAGLRRGGQPGGQGPVRGRRGHRPAGRAVHAGRPEPARAYGLEALNRALDGGRGHHRGAHLLRVRGDHPRPPVRLLVPARAGRLPGRPDLHRDRTVQPGHVGAQAPARTRRSSSA